jgi:hypothetical protein
MPKARGGIGGGAGGVGAAATGAVPLADVPLAGVLSRTATVSAVAAAVGCGLAAADGGCGCLLGEADAGAGRGEAGRPVASAIALGSVAGGALLIAPDEETAVSAGKPAWRIESLCALGVAMLVADLTGALSLAADRPCSLQPVGPAARHTATPNRNVMDRDSSMTIGSPQVTGRATLCGRRYLPA